MKDVAVLAGVSHQTVSRVLNGHDNVRHETRERVMAAMRELDYRPNSAARTLVTKDRKSTRLNSSHPSISYAVFCLKKKKNSIRINHSELLGNSNERPEHVALDRPPLVTLTPQPPQQLITRRTTPELHAVRPLRRSV